MRSVFLLHRGVGGVALDAVDAVQAAGLGLVALGGGDDLAVAGLQAEPVFAGLVGIHFKLGMLDGLEALHGLVLDLAHAVVADALDAVEAGCLGAVDFGGGDHFAVGGLEVEFNAGVGLLDYEFSHDVSFLSKKKSVRLHACQNSITHCDGNVNFPLFKGKLTNRQIGV